MLLQKWRSPEDDAAAVEYILMIVSTGSRWHDVSIHATGTFGDQKVMLSLVTGLWPSEQRLLFKGKEIDNCEHLHMVGVQDNDKVLLLEDLAVKERKLRLVAAVHAVAHRGLVSAVHVVTQRRLVAAAHAVTRRRLPAATAYAIAQHKLITAATHTDT
ncbi:hypothetical protein BDA96_07G012500 [Sorghum bicolor]|uniref:Ubiquitin-like domain-containing protein n=2 Tax=Sorghum bicolor TaxID=4558 RepID=A0A921QJY9_SORBI|nr:hypothetical protein SORBI_3007G012001 [Sorghum bicolor]KAG0522157.1 hypothetical protein BDA96_07G012500 [Sorghum bicolor]